MSPDTLGRLRSSIDGTNKATSNMIDRAIHPGKFPTEEITTIEDLLAALPSSIMTEFVRQRGNLNRRKYLTFINDIEELFPQFGASNLAKITNECICPDGRINTTKLQDVISKRQA